jgi:steroid delta-isomerase-like uncharacterized protein
MRRDRGMTNLVSRRTVAKERPMTDTEDALTLARTLLDALNRGDRAGVQALLAETVTEREPLEQEVIAGPEAVVASIWSYRNSFPDLRVEVTDGFASGDRAAVQFTAVGTYEPYTYGSHAKQVTWRGCMIVRADAGQLVQLDTYVDWLEPVQQLGEVAFAPVLKREGA